MKISSQIKLTLVTKNDGLFLYNRLKERESIVNISHKKMPTYTQHMKFIESKPYSKWYIIKFGNKKIGTAYLTRQNEIGIHIIKDMRSKKLGTSVLKILMKKNRRKRYSGQVRRCKK